MRMLPRFYKRGRTYIMGVLNVTPDSFSDGGRFFRKEPAIKHALQLVRDGADIIDIGGESTRPGAGRISVDEELSRVIPVVLAVSKKTRAYISVDTSKAKVAEEAIKAGAILVNDVSGLKYDHNMASVAAKYRVGIIVMHMRGTPKSMQLRPRYRDVVKDVIQDLRVSLKIARTAGISDDSVIIDPGIGFGKTFKHNLTILKRLNEFAVLKRPICIGTSRKSFIGKILGDRYEHERLIGTIATSVIAIMKGARIIRVHDAKEASSAARMVGHILGYGAN